MRRSFHILLVAACVTSSLGAAGIAGAFPFSNVWTESASGSSMPAGSQPTGRAGGENIFYTGSPSPGTVKNAGDYRMGCEVCHVAKKDDGSPQDPAMLGKISASFTGLPANNKYTPGMSYTITVDMVGEQYTGATQRNGVNITVRDAQGKLSGVIGSDMAGNDSNNAPTACPLSNAYPANATTFVCGPNTNRVLISAPRNQITSWTFRWTAPAAGSGTATIYYSMVDGNHSDMSSLGDDVKTGTLVLMEGP